jgi:adenylate cyclase
MGIQELTKELDSDIKNILSNEFSVTITDTKVVPSISDTAITYPNLDKKEIKAKKIQTCVLYIDIRKSTDINLKHYPVTLTKLYGAFMRSMVKAAQLYNGRVRNIIGDRVMVVFDEINCYKNAINTAVLLNSVAKYILNKHFTQNEITCGIGIDYGRMLVSKGGVIKNGGENIPYKSLVWLGRPANVASKLTDLANKTVEVETTIKKDYLMVLYKTSEEYIHFEMSYEEFMNEEVNKRTDVKLVKAEDNSNFFVSHDPFITGYFPQTKVINSKDIITTPPILITEKVFLGYKKACTDANDIKNNKWKVQDNNLYSNYRIYGTDLIFSDVKSR